LYKDYDLSVGALLKDAWIDAQQTSRGGGANLLEITHDLYMLKVATAIFAFGNVITYAGFDDRDIQYKIADGAVELISQQYVPAFRGVFAELDMRMAALPTGSSNSITDLALA